MKPRQNIDIDARAALDFIRETYARRGYPPSRREIAGHLGLASPHGGQRLIDHLVEKGLIEVDRGVPRGIRVVGKADTEKL